MSSNTVVTVRHVMETRPIGVAPNCPLHEVLRLMNQHRIGSVLVVQDTDRLVGIFTERDLLKRIVTAPNDWRDYLVSQWMTRDPYIIGPDIGWEDAVVLMGQLRVRHLPVIEHGRLIGLVSPGRLLAHRTEHLSRSIEERTRELRAANELLIARDAELMYNLRTAGRLQTKLLLPSTPAEWPELSWAVYCAPLDHLGGDFYDFAHPATDHLGFLIADASGHSISASMVAVMARTAFAEASRATAEPGDVLGAMNRRLQELTDERFVTAFYGVYDRRDGLFRYAGAGHPYPLRYEARTGTVSPLGAQGFVLGIIPDEVYVPRGASLAPGDRVCFYTDGLIEARNEIGEMFGTERLTELLKGCASRPANEVLRCVLDDLTAFRGGTPLTDDLSVAVMAVTGF